MLLKYIGFEENERELISKDKIRSKIKELEKEKDRYFKENGFVPYYLQILININNKIDILKELLKE